MGTPELRERGEKGRGGDTGLWCAGTRVDKRRAGSGCCSGIEDGAQIVLKKNVISSPK
jgi:hypothetical protein